MSWYECLTLVLPLIMSVANPSPRFQAQMGPLQSCKMARVQGNPNPANPSQVSTAHAQVLQTPYPMLYPPMHRSCKMARLLGRQMRPAKRPTHQWATFQGHSYLRLRFVPVGCRRPTRPTPFHPPRTPARQVANWTCKQS